MKGNIMCQVSNVTQKLKKSKIKLAVDKKGKKYNVYYFSNILYNMLWVLETSLKHWTTFTKKNNDDH